MSTAHRASPLLAVVLGLALGGCDSGWPEVRTADAAAVWVREHGWSEKGFGTLVSDVNCTGPVDERLGDLWHCRFVLKRRERRERWECDLPRVLRGEAPVGCGPARDSAYSVMDETTHLRVARSGKRTVRFSVTFDGPTHRFSRPRGSRARRGPARRAYLYAIRTDRPYAALVFTARLRCYCRMEGCFTRASGAFPYSQDIELASNYFVCTRAAVFIGMERPGRVAENFMNADGCGDRRLY